MVISSSEIEKSFFDTVSYFVCYVNHKYEKWLLTNYSKYLFKGRLYLSAETATEMNEWISQIRTAMTTLRDGRKPTRSSKSLPADSATNNEVSYTQSNAHIQIRKKRKLVCVCVCNKTRSTTQTQLRAGGEKRNKTKAGPDATQMCLADT